MCVARKEALSDAAVGCHWHGVYAFFLNSGGVMGAIQYRRLVRLLVVQTRVKMRQVHP